MKNLPSILFVLFLLSLLNSCRNDSFEFKEQYSFDDHISKIDSFEEKNHFLDEYRNTLSDVLYKVKEINSQKSKSEMDSLVLNY